MYICIVILSLFVGCSLAAHNIIFGSSALTLVTTTNPYSVSLLPISVVNDPKQLWNINNGFISSAATGFTEYVISSGTAEFKAATRAVPWQKSTTSVAQQWIVEDGFIKSKSGNGYYLTPQGTTIVGTYTAPQKFDIISNTWECYSHGTPRITPYHLFKRNDVFFPGPQIPGTFTLSVTGKPTDTNYLLIQVDQQQCSSGVAGSYCNKRAILKTKGHVVEVRHPLVFIDGDKYVGAPSGTVTVGDGVSITYKDKLRVVINHPNGYVEVTHYTPNITNVNIVATSGSLPTGGLCTKLPSVASDQFFLTWRAKNRTEDLFSYDSEQQWKAANPSTWSSNGGYFTSFNPQLLVDAVETCSSLHPTSSIAVQCEKQASSKIFYQACFHDFLSTTLESTASTLLDGYSRLCSKSRLSPPALPTSGRFSTANVGPVSWSTKKTCFSVTSKDVNGQIVTSGTDKFTITSSAGEVFTQQYLGAGAYQACYTPSELNHLISVSLKGVAISGSPFSVSVRSNYSSPVNSKIEGPGLHGPIKPDLAQRITLTTYTVDQIRRTSGGDIITVVVSGNSNVGAVVDNKDGTYDFSYLQFTENIWFGVIVSINGRPMAEVRVLSGIRD